MKNLKPLKSKNFITISLIILLCIILILILYKSDLFSKISQKRNFEKQVLEFAKQNEKTIFSINQITLFSSCDAQNKIGNKSNFTIENLYAYTDIAIFINKNAEENNLENTLKNVIIKNISIDTPPQQGQANLYYKNLNQFAKSILPSKTENSEANLQPIENELEFTTISNETSDYSKPVLYNNCANPITLSYITQNIKSDYTILDTSTPITYNGSLLKRCAVPIEKIYSQISLEINITNYKDEKFKSKVFITIPYKNENQTIYDGNITIKQNPNFVFYKYN